MDQIKIGRFVAELRKQKGWTQAQLGEKLGVTNKTVSRWENGNYMPELAVIPELAAALEVSVNELIAGERFAEAEYKRGADEQLLKTMQLIEEIREIKDSRWLSRGFGSMALAIFVAGFVNIVILQTNIGDYQPSNAWILLILAIVIAGVLGIMYLNVVYIPYTNVLKLGETAFVGSYTLNSRTRECSVAAVAAIEQRLLECYEKDDYFRITSQKARMEMMIAVQSSMLSVLSAIAGIALLVGGVGIMNIMSISVAERTREIGVRKSFGARRRDIRLQFIIEAGSTSALGGLLGVALGLAASFLACRFMQLPFQLAGDSVLLSFGVSVVLGVIFGFLPAGRAARLEPIDALRYD